jgi:hypothetical protein
MCRKCFKGFIIKIDASFVHVQRWNGRIRHPEVAVKTLLADVLRVIQEQSENFKNKNEYFLNKHHICALAENAVVKAVLGDTCELSVIDLDLLVPGDETLVFYTNLANLMWIHSLLILETSSQSMDSSVIFERMKDYSIISASNCDQCWNTEFGFCSLCLLEREVAQMIVGYNVGKLGFISLQEVYRQLLGELTFRSTTPFSTSAVLAKLPRNRSSSLPSTSIDPRVLFVLLNGRRQSPKTQVRMHVCMIVMDL